MKVNRLKSGDTTTRLAPGLRCPTCGADNDATTGDGTPSPGDFTICAYCATIARFDARLKPRQLTLAEALDAAADPALQDGQRIVKKMIASRKQRNLP